MRGTVFAGPEGTTESDRDGAEEDDGIACRVWFIAFVLLVDLIGCEPVESGVAFETDFAKAKAVDGLVFICVLAKAAQFEGDCAGM